MYRYEGHMSTEILEMPVQGIDLQAVSNGKGLYYPQLNSIDLGFDQNASQEC